MKNDVHKTVNILGANYSVDFVDKIEGDKGGETNIITKQILISNENDSKDGVKIVLRHEIIHAFMYESGLWTNCDWHTEEMVDWFAIQMPKILNVMLEF